MNGDSSGTAMRIVRQLSIFLPERAVWLLYGESSMAMRRIVSGSSRCRTRCQCARIRAPTSDCIFFTKARAWNCGSRTPTSCDLSAEGGFFFLFLLELLAVASSDTA